MNEGVIIFKVVCFYIIFKISFVFFFLNEKKVVYIVCILKCCYVFLKNFFLLKLIFGLIFLFFLYFGFVMVCYYCCSKVMLMFVMYNNKLVRNV